MTETGFALRRADYRDNHATAISRLRLVLAKTNPTRALKAFVKTIGDRPDTGEAGPDRASTCRIRAVDAQAIRRRASHYDRLSQFARPDRVLRGSPDGQREFRQRPFRKTDSSSMAETKRG